MTLDGYKLSIDEIVGVARGEDKIELSFTKDSYERMIATRDMKNGLIDSGVPIYGVTSGFGDSNTRQISKQKTVQL
ncbi:aromatic amino acid lyase, partial [Streptomyces anulatus]|uniref:aromatic amino acid lyase n=2 Tax=Actinomycetes TaxID=1760 RepID=UPI0036B1AE1C